MSESAIHHNGDRKRLHYAWVIVIASFIIYGISAAIKMSFGVFIDPLLEDFGWTRAMISASYSLQFIVWGVSSIWAGTLSDRYGTRIVTIIGSLLFLVSMLLTGRTQSLWELYLYYGIIMGIGMSAFSSPIISMVSRWFDRKIGVALGLVTAAQGLVTLVLAPLLRYIITILDWRTAFTLTGIIGGALVLLSALLLRNLPSDIGLLPYGNGIQGDKVNKSTGSSSQTLLPGLGEARRSSPFWFLISVHFLGCIGHSIPLVHVVSYATGMGIQGIVAASILGFTAGFTILGRFGMAVLGERIGGRKALALTLAFQALGVLIFLTARELWVFYLAASALGIGFGGEMVTFPIINREYFHSSSLGSINGYQFFGAGLGMAAGGYLGGLLFDLTGAYYTSFWVAAISSVLGVFAIMAMRESSRTAISVSQLELPSPKSYGN